MNTIRRKSTESISAFRIHREDELPKDPSFEYKGHQHQLKLDGKVEDLFLTDDTSVSSLDDGLQLVRSEAALVAKEKLRSTDRKEVGFQHDGREYVASKEKFDTFTIRPESRGAREPLTNIRESSEMLEIYHTVVNGESDSTQRLVGWHNPEGTITLQGEEITVNTISNELN